MRRFTCCADVPCTRPCVSADVPYCHLHRCAWTHTPCPEAAEIPSRFCEQHKCPTSRCAQSCREAGMYCDGHRCWYGGEGVEDVEDCPQRNSGDGSYCLAHTCWVGGCFDMTLPDAAGCDYHTCHWTGEGVRCGEEVLGSQYCTGHQCLKRSCTNPRAYEAGYCPEHVCTVGGCYERRVDQGGGNAMLCTHHAAENQRQTAVATRPPHNVDRQAQNQSATNQAVVDYGNAFFDGAEYALNLPAADRGRAQAAFGQRTRSGREGQDQSREILAGVSNRAIQTQANNSGYDVGFGGTQVIEGTQHGHVEEWVEELAPAVGNMDLNPNDQAYEGNTYPSPNDQTYEANTYPNPNNQTYAQH